MSNPALVKRKPTSKPMICTARTKRGMACMYRAKVGSDKCGIHTPKPQLHKNTQPLGQKVSPRRPLVVAPAEGTRASLVGPISEPGQRQLIRDCFLTLCWIVSGRVEGFPFVPCEIIEMIWQWYMIASTIPIAIGQETNYTCYYGLVFGMRHGRYRRITRHIDRNFSTIAWAKKQFSIKNFAVYERQFKKEVIECNYKMDLVHGVFIHKLAWGPNAPSYLKKTVKQITYHQGLKHGEFSHTITTASGTTIIRKQGQFHHGMRTGQWVWRAISHRNWLPDGDPDQRAKPGSHPDDQEWIRVTNYRNGKRHGEHKTFSGYGRHVTTATYFDGVRVTKRHVAEEKRLLQLAQESH